MATPAIDEQQQFPLFANLAPNSSAAALSSPLASVPTMQRWNKPDEQHAWVGVELQSHSEKRYYIPRERLFYSVEDALGDSPVLSEPARVLELPTSSCVTPTRRPRRWSPKVNAHWTQA